jgi:hypothetical protein
MTLRMPPELHQRLIDVALALNMELTSLVALILTEGIIKHERVVKRRAELKGLDVGPLMMRVFAYIGQRDKDQQGFAEYAEKENKEGFTLHFPDDEMGQRMLVATQFLDGEDIDRIAERMRMNPDTVLNWIKEEIEQGKSIRAEQARQGTQALRSKQTEAKKKGKK